MRIIIESRGNTYEQCRAAKSVIAAGHKEGDIVIIQIGEEHYGVKVNKGSVRVYLTDNPRNDDDLLF